MFCHFTDAWEGVVLVAVTTHLLARPGTLLLGEGCRASCCGCKWCVIVFGRSRFKPYPWLGGSVGWLGGWCVLGLRYCPGTVRGLLGFCTVFVRLVGFCAGKPCWSAVW